MSRNGDKIIYLRLSTEVSEMCCSYSYWFQFYCFQPWESILSGIFKKNMTINYSSSSITRVEEAETQRERERVTEEQQYHPVCMCVSTRGTYIGGSADGVDGRLMMQIVYRSTADVIKQLHTHTDTLDAHVHSPPMSRN